MRNKLIIFLLVLAILISSYQITNTVYAYENIESSAKSMVVLEGNTDIVLYGKEENKRLPMASTTKIATAIIAIENCENLDEKIKISPKAIGIEGTSIYLKNGELLSMKELLYGLILASGNDCAVAIAEYFGGETKFVEMMNNFVSKLKLTNTHFDNPHGLDSETHYTSAYDLAKITSYALKNNFFKELVSTERMVIPKTEEYGVRYLRHKNRLLFTDDNCIGVKTGFTDNAGRCLVHAHDENGMRIISVVLNCQPMFEECDRLTKLAMNNFVMKEFIEPYNFVSNINIIDSEKTEVGVIAIEGFKKPILKSEENRYFVKYNLPDNINAPIKLNEIVGSVEVFYDDNVIYKGNLITIEDAKNNDLRYLFDEIIDRWF